MTGSVGGSATVAGMSVLDNLDAHSAAYGIIGAFTIGLVGIVVQRRQNARMHKIETDKLDELKRHNRAQEERKDNGRPST